MVACETSPAIIQRMCEQIAALGRPVVPEVKTKMAGCSERTPRRSARSGFFRLTPAQGTEKSMAVMARNEGVAANSGSGHSQSMGRSRVSGVSKAGRHSSPTITALAPDSSIACLRGRPRLWVLSKAAVTPILLRPNQMMKNSGRFSIARAQTSPRSRPSAAAACATWFERALTSS